MTDDPCNSQREALRLAVEKLGQLRVPGLSMEEAMAGMSPPEDEDESEDDKEARQYLEAAQQELIEAEAALAECQEKHEIKPAAEEQA